MTDEMAPVDDATMYRRKIDNSLARFSAAHDELEQAETQKRERREKLSARPAQLLEHTWTALQRVVHPENNSAKAAAPLGEDEPDDGHPQAKPAAGTGTEDSPKTRLQEKKKRHQHRTEIIARVTAIALAGLFFLTIGVGWGAKTLFNSKFTTVAALDENSQDIQDASKQRDTENFLLVGSDSRAGAETEENVGNADGVPGARADTVMIAHIPADRSQVVVVSFPRDLEVSRPTCNRWDPTTSKTTSEVVSGQKIAKLNSVYTIGGPSCLTKLIQQMTGMRINHFVGIDFNGFKDMVDAAGGVQVHLDQPIDDTTLGNIFPKAGDLTISGDDALNYVRARHVKGDPTSDYGRIKRQQQFIGSLLKKAMSKDVVLSPTKLTSFVNAFAKATFGENIGVDQLLTLAQSMRGLDTGKIKFLTIPTVGTANSRGNEVLLKDKADQVFQALIENSPLPGEEPPTAPTSSSAAASPTTETSTSSSSTSTKSEKSRR
jgi:LCP family protein required for cell wall assembly